MKRIVTLLLLASAVVSCSRSVVSPQETDVVQTSSTAQGLTKGETQTLLSAPAVRHTFSDGTTITLVRAGDTYFVPGQELGYSSVRALPGKIAAMERVHAAGVTGQAVGMMPGAVNNGSPLQWPSGTAKGEIYYDIGTFPSDLRNLIDSAIATWNATSVGVKLYNQRTSGRNGTVLYPIYKYFTIIGSGSGSIPEAVIKSLGCDKVPAFTSQIGYGETGGDVAGTIYFNPQCFTGFSAYPSTFKSTVIHEIGHIVGLYHQQAYCGRTNFVNLSFSGTPGPFDVPYQQNFGEACGSTLYGNLTTYDFNSVMHYRYGAYPYSTTTVTMSRKTTITSPYCGSPDQAGTTLTLSVGDINGINRMYRRGVSSTGC